MAAPDDVDVKEMAPDAAAAEAEETPPTRCDKIKAFYVLTYLLFELCDSKGPNMYYMGL